MRILAYDSGANNGWPKMMIPELPGTVEQLDLMTRLDAYGEGKASWRPEEPVPGVDERKACRELHTNIRAAVDKVLAPMLDKVNAPPMETFTLHDRKHGLKVAHVMWHILTPERRERLTPPEIGLMVLAAHLHDLGMGLTPEERAERLASDELWYRLDWDEALRERIEALRREAEDANLEEPARRRLRQKLHQAEEAVLCADTRERHATRERYEELLGRLQATHNEAPARIPDFETCLSFYGDSFRRELIDICVSHNQDAIVLKDERSNRPRFDRKSPFGCATADLQVVAAALRLADILDFDRERTPPALFHYLMPGPLAPEEDRSVLEWGKHLAISNWEIGDSGIVFRGRSQSHIIHHAVVQFCAAIEKEIGQTRSTFGDEAEAAWPFVLPAAVKAEITEEGYRYVPYRFELDDQRIYELLMGRQIYDNPLVAVRELIQNAVDACKLRDALRQLGEPETEPAKTKRIFVRYEEPTSECPQPRLTVRDSGIGMDRYVIENYFLKVGQSYYRSVDFNRHRADLRKAGVDFAPVSEFGIGFLSCFMLADRLKVETALTEQVRQDTLKRTLVIDGPTRLIRLDEQPNDGVRRQRGTAVTLYLVRGGEKREWGEKQEKAPTWEDVRRYIQGVCLELPYDLHLEHAKDGSVEQEVIPGGEEPAFVPPELEQYALRIPVDDTEGGLQGELVLVNDHRIREQKREGTGWPEAVLLRGGFRVSGLPGQGGPPGGFSSGIAGGRVRILPRSDHLGRLPSPNLARSAMADGEEIASRLTRLRVKYLIDHRSQVDSGYYSFPCSRRPLAWLEEYDAYTVYEAGRKGWQFVCGIPDGDLKTWEDGIGTPLPFPAPWMFSGVLLQMVLPRVSGLIISETRDMMVKAPHAGWRQELRTWQAFVRDPIEWNFADFLGRVAKLFSGPCGRFVDSYVINERFRTEVNECFGTEEVRELRNLVRLLVGGPISLPAREYSLFKRLVERFGSCSIGWRTEEGIESRRIDSFQVEMAK